MAFPNDIIESPGQHTFSATSEAQSAGGPSASGTVHKRTYQACLPCRRRKVRCDLGSVDEPGDPPCQRCRREKKDCVFSETRRKRKHEDDGSDLTDDYVARNKRSANYLGPQYSGEHDGGSNYNHSHHDDDGSPSSSRMLPGFRHGSPRGLPAGTSAYPQKVDKAAANRDVANETAAELFQRPIIQPEDALNMLVDAASRTEVEDQKGRKSHLDRERLLAKQTHRLSSSGQQRPTDLTNSSSAIIDPAIMEMHDTAQNHRTNAEADLSAALQAWSRLRFVQGGWFTAREAIGYIDYFYENLAPLTPISPPDFSNYAEHPRLLNEEPMLTVTLLTIASRYKILDGPGGATRSFRVHDKLWAYLQKMVTRMFWGQEQFGGGFCGAGGGVGGSRTQEEIEAKARGLRSLGTAESLLLLSDWLPRAMHFNPGDDAGEILVGAPLNYEDGEGGGTQSVTGAHAAWTEPALRSDRMIWSLVGMAYTLSWELGVFDSLLEEKRWAPGPQAKTKYSGERADRIGRMLLVYVSQACGRLGYPNMMPSQGNETNFNFLKMDIPEGTYPGPYSTITEADKIQRAWAELTALMRQSNTEMFESKTKVNKVIKDGSYKQFLEEWGPRMKDWKDKFDRTEMPQKARTILQMEWEYTKIYIYSVSLQAVVESCAAPVQDNEENKPANAHTPPALFSSKVVDVHKQNRMYIEELINAARNVLRLAVDGLGPSGALRHAPVRTHFRILSAAMFIFKSFAVGGKESEVSISLHLLDKTIKAVRDSVIDDVHLSLRIAELLSGIVKGLRQKFVRLAVATSSRSSKQRQMNAHRPSTSHPTSAPKGDRRTSATTPTRNQNNNSSSTTTGPNGAVTPPSAPYGGHPDNWYSSLGLDEAPPLVNLKDAGTPLSPHSSHTALAGGLDSPPLGAIGGSGPNGNNGNSRPRNSSFDQPSNGQMPFSPAQAGFSPLSTNSGGGSSSGGYDWLALDFNPLLANGGIHFGPGDPPGGGNGAHNFGDGSGQNGHASSSHNHHQHDQQGHGNGHGLGAGNGAEGLHDGTGASTNGYHGHASSEHEEGQGTVGASPWTMGAFGPEISEGLEMLNALGALVWDDPGQGGASW